MNIKCLILLSGHQYPNLVNVWVFKCKNLDSVIWDNPFKWMVRDHQYSTNILKKESYGCYYVSGFHIQYVAISKRIQVVVIFFDIVTLLSSWYWITLPKRIQHDNGNQNSLKKMDSEIKFKNERCYFFWWMTGRLGF